MTTIRSHDQFNTTIYSNDRYRGLKGLRTVVFMNSSDMGDFRGLEEFDLIDIAGFKAASGPSTATAVSHDIPRGCAAGYMPS